MQLSWLVKGMALVAVVGTIAAQAPQADAQNYPRRPITAIYPYAPGSLPEIAFRLVLGEAGNILGQRIVVENRPGAGAMLGFREMMRAPADGYVIGHVASPFAVNAQLLDPSTKTEPVKDYTPIIRWGDSNYVLAVNPSLPFKDLKAMVAYAKANPGKLAYGFNGTGGGGQLGMELLKSATAIDLLPVPYNGDPLATTALVSNEIQAYFGAGILKPFTDAGQAIPLATSGKNRWPLFPAVPTLNESLGQDLSFSTWFGIGGPPNMPEEVVTALYRAIYAAGNLPAVKQKLDEFGITTDVRMAQPEFTDFIRSDIERWRKVITTANIKLN